MPVHFSAANYENLRKMYRLWWNDELNRPIVPIVVDEGASVQGPQLCFATAWDMSLSPKELIDAHDRRLSSRRFYGEAYPWLNFDAFGPGVLAAFLGCAPVGRKETVWFMPPKANMELAEMRFEFDPQNPCFRRVAAFYEEGMEKWGGMVVLGMADLGGILDILASFRGTENLLMDLIDDPDEVIRCIDDIQRAWFACYDEINRIIGPGAMGHTQWLNLYGEEPGYILQSDFSYMISPEMFAQFVAPELKSSAARLKNAIYHLDGMGEIPHLEQILSIGEIKGIQWVPGAGPGEMMDWTELTGRILQGEKKLLSVNTKPDGTPVDHADPRKLFLGDRYFANIDSAQRYAALYEIEI